MPASFAGECTKLTLDIKVFTLPLCPQARDVAAPQNGEYKLDELHRDPAHDQGLRIRPWPRTIRSMVFNLSQIKHGENAKPSAIDGDDHQ
ncbi:hypothetical protein EVAR_52973_1 [Eumeta japonica]|uniref:Uncharacterized protein n=1 Tax=Eumeta variegata TaxID=151549 RepID=A0A4C1YYU3_EUMVA|nr:hypothetical protein EVAR_52973_1 [Eumeta japonica]